MKTLIILLLSCIFSVSVLYAQTPSAGRQITGIDFQADLISAGRQITGIDFQADLISAGRQITGVDFIATSTKERPDLAILEIQTSPPIDLGRPAKIKVLMQNKTAVECRECTVFLEAEDGYKDKASVSFGPESKESAVFSWTPRQEGRQTLSASLECRGGDSNPKNNELSQKVAVMGRHGEQGNETGINREKIKMQEKSGKLPIELEQEEK